LARRDIFGMGQIAVGWFGDFWAFLKVLGSRRIVGLVAAKKE
jgi:hypothetical protein